jgi:hydrocephalus-inducing protein
VTAPRFRFSPDRIDFGSVSYSFTREKEIFLINESNVSFTYSLRIPGDGKLT